MVFRFLDKFRDGGEIMDDTPLSIPVTMRRPPTLAEQIARITRSQQMQAFAESQGKESFDEADDFDIPDDPIPQTSPYEENFDLANLQASDRGVVAPFDESGARKAKERVSDAYKKWRKSSKGSSTEAPQVSKGEEPPLE